MKILKNQLGKTEIQVSQLGFGAASLGNLYRAISDHTAKQAMIEAVQSGMTLFDTAPHYGIGLSERRVGDVLRDLEKNQYIISTKVGRVLNPVKDIDTSPLRYGFQTPMPFDAHYDYSYDGIMRSYEDSQQRLGLSSIDILLVHDIGIDTHGDKNDFYFNQLDKLGGYQALDELRRCGDIKAVGLGVNETAVCEKAMAIGQFDCFLLAGRYSLLEQEPLDHFLPKCIEHGASIILGGPYNSGILATGVKNVNEPYYNYAPAPQAIIDRVAKIQTICEDFNVTLAAAALQFPLGHPAVVSVIPGIGSAKRVLTTIELFNEIIPAEFWFQLKEEKLLAEDAPVPNQSQYETSKAALREN